MIRPFTLRYETTEAKRYIVTFWCKTLQGAIRHCQIECKNYDHLVEIFNA